VEVQKHGVDHYVMKKVPNGWFAKSYTLQRGHGSYVSEGEEEELALGPVNHVVFVVHGIGEAWFSKDKTTSMVETMDQLRLVFQKRQVADWKKKCDAAKKKRCACVCARVGVLCCVVFREARIATGVVSPAYLCLIYCTVLCRFVCCEQRTNARSSEPG